MDAVTPPVSCALCGARPSDGGDPTTVPLGWSSDVADDARVRHVCPDCTRRHVRSIEGKLDPEWW